MDKYNTKQTYLMAATIATMGFITVTLGQGVEVMTYGILTMSLLALLLAFKLKAITIKQGPEQVKPKRQWSWN